MLQPPKRLARSKATSEFTVAEFVGGLKVNPAMEHSRSLDGTYRRCLCFGCEAIGWLTTARVKSRRDLDATFPLAEIRCPDIESATLSCHLRQLFLLHCCHEKESRTAAVSPRVSHGACKAELAKAEAGHAGTGGKRRFHLLRPGCADPTRLGSNATRPIRWGCKLRLRSGVSDFGARCIIQCGPSWQPTPPLFSDTSSE